MRWVSSGLVASQSQIVYGSRSRKISAACRPLVRSVMYRAMALLEFQ
jgi:hypothetical protein